MSSTSYYRTPSHYNDEHLYAIAASSWQQDPNHASYTVLPPAPFLHYSQGGADSVAHPSAPAPQSWSVHYPRQAPQAWNQPGPAIPYDAAEGSVPVLHPSGEALRHYQHEQPLNTRQEVPLSTSDNAYRSANRFHELRTPSVGVQKCRVLR